MDVHQLINDLQQIGDKKKIVKLAVNGTVTGNFHLNDEIGTRLYLTNQEEEGYKEPFLTESVEKIKTDDGLVDIRILSKSPRENYENESVYFVEVYDHEYKVYGYQALTALEIQNLFGLVIE
jgi:hypothetical protein